MYQYSLAPVRKQSAGTGGDYSRPRKMRVLWAGQSNILRENDSIPSTPRSRTANSIRTSASSIRTFMLCLGVVLSLATKAASAHPTLPNSLASHTLNLPPILYTPPAHNLDTIIELDPEFPAILLDYEPPHDHSSQQHIAKRQDDEAPPISTGKASPRTSTHTSSHATASGASRATTTMKPSSSAKGTTTLTMLPEETDFPLPTPFEAMGNNFTVETCPNFIKSMVKADQFKACLPFSTFLETSTSFFQMMKSPYQTTSFLDRSCRANTTVCSKYLTDLARILILPENCKSDFDQADPIVHQAHNALLAYLPLYSASCLRNDAGTGYCFTDMAGNASAWMDPSVYSLGIGKPLVAGGVNATATSKAGKADGGALPLSCSSCLQRVMGVLNSAANSGQDDAPVRKVWKAGAQAVNGVCGANWVNETVVEVALSGSAERQSAAAVLPLIVAVVAVVVLF